MISVRFNGCFGCLHPGTLAHGVVLCAPIGGEGLMVHRALRSLAEDLAAQGWPSLRFDYRGTGNSCGDETAPAQFDAWVRSLRDACAFLVEATGVSSLSLVGLGIGATLAAIAAETIPELRSLALLTPVVEGAGYLPDMQVLAELVEAYETRFSQEPTGPRRAPPRRSAGLTESGDADAEVLGFTYTAETVAALARLDLRRMDRLPAPRILVLKHPRRARRLADGQLAETFRGLGGAVEEEEFAGYLPFTRGPASGLYPAVAFGRLRAWLAESADRSPLPARPPVAPGVLHGPGWTESDGWFGDCGTLFGITCRPDRAAAGSALVVMLNTWWNHHVGVGNLSVSLARHLAALGHTSLRFDVAGLGESAAPMDGAGLPSLARAAVDLRSVLDHCERLGHSGFVLVGVCWGAMLAATYGAVRDARILGQVLVDMPSPSLDEAFTFDPAAVAVHTLMVFSGADPGGGAAGPHGRIARAVVADADHGFRNRAGRGRLIDLVTARLHWLFSEHVLAEGR